MKSKAFALVMAAVLACSVVAGCGGGSSSSTSAESNGGEKSGTQTEPASASEESYNVGLVTFASADPTSSAAIKGYETYAKSKGWTTTTIDSQGSPDKAVAAIQNLLQKQVDLIVTTVWPPESLAAGAIAAEEAGVPILSFGGGTGEGVQVNYDAGVTQGKEIAELMVAETEGKGKLLELGYKSGLPCLEREEALEEAIAGKEYDVTRDEVTIPGQVEAGTKFAQAWLAQNAAGSENMTVWACFDDPGLGAISAINQEGRKGVRVYGVNGTPAAVAAVEAGEMTATIYLDVEGAGRLMAERTPEYVEAGVDAKPIDVPIPSALVDKNTLTKVKKKYPEAFAGE